jgi:serine/threonine-protein kinase
MAPEQFRGGEADAAADIWAVGIITHEMPAGRHPFEGGSAASLMQAILEKAPSSLADARPDAPPELIGLAAAALQKDRARRRLTAAEAAEQARALLARLAAPGVRALSRPGRRRWMPRAAAAALIAVGTAMFLWHWARHAGKARWARDIALPRIEELAARIHGGISAGGERGALARRR